MSYTAWNIPWVTDGKKKNTFFGYRDNEAQWPRPPVAWKPSRSCHCRDIGFPEARHGVRRFNVSRPQYFLSSTAMLSLLFQVDWRLPAAKLTQNFEKVERVWNPFYFLSCSKSTGSYQRSNRPKVLGRWNGLEWFFVRFSLMHHGLVQSCSIQLVVCQLSHHFYDLHDSKR